MFGLLIGVAAVSAQPRPMEKGTNKTETNSTPKKSAPASFEAKYEGGMFGFDKKETGVLKFDDINQRLIFFGKDQKEKFSIPYKSLLVVSPQSQSVRSTTGTVISAVPLPGAGLAGLLRKKNRYLVINFDDPDVNAHGIANFKLDNLDLLESVVSTLGEKAELSQRGDAYYRPKNQSN